MLLANGNKVGTTESSSSGSWSITSSALADGSYSFTAEMLNPENATEVAQSVTFSPSILIDTTGPTVSSVVFVPKTDELHVTFQDTGSGLNLASVSNAANYQLALPSARSTFSPTGLTLTPGAPGSGQVTVNISYNLGRRVKTGAYVVTILADSITDNAGNTLVETHFVTFPQTTNSPNPNYVAEINVGAGLTASSPEVYISPAGPRRSRVHRALRAEERG